MNRFRSVFSNSVYWYKINPLYRLKIALGILEFFSYATAFNPNSDEFGETPSSLLLCAPIEHSFGYTFFNEAKLVNYDGLLTTQEALDNLNKPHKCRYDSDCVLNENCAFQCNVKTGRCTGKLTKLQLSQYCEFLQKFFEGEKNISGELEPLLKKCIVDLQPFYADRDILYGKSQMPLTYSKVNEFVSMREFWSRAEDYSFLLNELEKVMWERVRLAPDQKRPKKKESVKNNDETSSV